MQPTAQAVGKAQNVTTSPEGAKKANLGMRPEKNG